VRKETLTLVIPVFNDWESFGRLVREIDSALDGQMITARVIAMDDGSTEPLPDLEASLGALKSVAVLEVAQLVRNLGHQRAIAVGLSHAVTEYASDRIVIMDADGEDRPATLPELLQESRATDRIAFATRGRRQEGAIFLIFYGLYRILFHVLTGKSIDFGNYCVIPRALAARAVLLPELWNHFAAGIIRSGLPRTAVKIPRGSRYFGKSKMKFVDLVLHGLSAISVYADVLAVRLILFTSMVIAGAVLGGLLLLYIRYFTDLAIPGWATTVAFGLATILFQAFMFLSLVSFMILGARNAATVVPLRHYRDFLLASRIIYGEA
jgi:polyisoprenyl-phosphate glycosyltransferase